MGEDESRKRPRFEKQQKKKQQVGRSYYELKTAAAAAAAAEITVDVFIAAALSQLDGIFTLKGRRGRKGGGKKNRT